MVPHRKILRAISLVAYCAADSEAIRGVLLARHQVRYPTTPAEFWEAEIEHWLSPAIRAAFMTTDVKLTNNVSFALAVGQELEVLEYIHWTHKGLGVNVNETILKWRSNPDMRVAIEVMLLCGLSVPQIQEDLRRMYGYVVDEADVRRFGDLYCDREFALGDNWFHYTHCVGTAEAKFKMTMMNQNREYVRWKLGVPVTLDSDVVLDRLMSDSYFTCQMIKAETGNQLTKDDLNRVKMERKTILDCMDRKSKYKEAAAASGNGSVANKAIEAISAITLKYTDEFFPLKEDLIQQGADDPPAPEPIVHPDKKI